MKKVVKITYACEICSSEFDTDQDALRCEQRGVALPEFKEFEVVELTGLIGVAEVTTVSGYNVGIRSGTRAVIQDDAKEGRLDSHCLPRRYNVWVFTLGQNIGARPIFKEIVGNIGREFLKKVHVHRDDCCHLCGCTILTLVRQCAYSYLGFGRKIPYLTVDVLKCSKCNVQFFTTAQSKNVDTLVRKKCCWPIANTKKLIKEYAFQY